MAIKRRLADNAEAVAFVVAAAVIATLLVWWFVFAGRLIDEVAALQRALLGAAPDAAELAAVEARAQRQWLMISGEGSLFGAMLLVCVGALFVVARQRRIAGQRLVKLLQFTTHELKTPIAGVRALLQSLQLGSIPEEARARLLDQGLLETNRLEHLAETILAYQRAASKARLRPQPASTRALVADIIEHRRRTFGGDALDHSGADDRSVMVDADAFRVVVENLLDNARKYGGGKVWVTETAAADRWRLAVKDDGIGFDDDGARLFEPFERDAGASTHGSGLGLYISRQLVRDMGGELVAHSDGKGKGATFVIELPLAAAVAAAAGPA